jgi:hypothetical protein
LPHYWLAIKNSRSQFNRGLASAQFGNQAQRTSTAGGRVTSAMSRLICSTHCGPETRSIFRQFGNVSGGSKIAPAPVYQATSDQYSAAMNAYNAKLQQNSALMGGLASLGGAGLMMI